jgi:hypothetical protein
MSVSTGGRQSVVAAEVGLYRPNMAIADHQELEPVTLLPPKRAYC